MSQPIWETVYATDYSKLRKDTTGVYNPELDMYDDWREWMDEEKELMPEGGWWERITIELEPCTYENGVLSDNPYWPDHAAWFAKDFNRVADSIGMEYEYLIDLICSTEPRYLAWAYEAIAGYWGRHEFGGDPRHFTDEEMEAAEAGLA